MSCNRPILVLCFTAACTPTIPEGRFLCELDQDCPPGMQCGSDLRCWTYLRDDGGAPLADATRPDAESEVDAGGDAGDEAGPPQPDSGTPCVLGGPEPFHIWSDGGVYCEDGSGGAFLGRGVGSTPSGEPYYGLELSACVRYRLPLPESVVSVTFTIEPAATACGSAACGSGACGTGRFAEIFDGVSHIGAYPMVDGRTTHTVTAQGEIVICRSAESQWRDQVHVVSVSCR